MMATGLIVGYSYIMEAFSAWYSGNVFEQAAMWNRMTGPVRIAVLDSDCLQRDRAQRALVQEDPQQPGAPLHLVADRAGGHVAGALCDHRGQPGAGQPALFLGHLPLHPLGRWATYLGTIGLFLFLFLLFIRLLPMISIFEVRTLLPQAKIKEETRGMNKPIYGVMAEFDNPSALVNAARAAREKGYRKLDAYSPFPIEELSDALHLHKNKLPLLVLIGGIIGGIAGLPAAVLRRRDLLSRSTSAGGRCIAGRRSSSSRLK